MASPETSQIARIALHWRNLGYAVLPLVDKVPKDRFKDLKGLQIYAARRRIGDIFVGDGYDRVQQGGLVLDGFRGIHPLAVVDVDDLAYLDRVRAVVPPTPLESTTGRAGGGRHLFYRLDLRTTSGSHTVKQLGSDLKLRASFVVVPGSLHVSGVEYRAFVDGQAIDPLSITADLLRSLPILPHETVESMIEGDREWRRKIAAQAPPRVVEIGEYQYASGSSDVVRTPPGSLSSYYSCSQGERVYPPCCPERSSRSAHGKVSWRGESRTPLIYCFHHRHSIVEETEWKAKAKPSPTPPSPAEVVGEPELSIEEGLIAAERDRVNEAYRRRRDGLPALVRVYETIGGEACTPRVVEETALWKGVPGLTSKERLLQALRAVRVEVDDDDLDPHVQVLLGLQEIGQERVDRLVDSVASEATLAAVQEDLDSAAAEVQIMKSAENEASNSVNRICPRLYEEVTEGWPSAPLDILYTSGDKSGKRASNLGFQPITPKAAADLDFQGVSSPTTSGQTSVEVVADPHESVARTLAYLADRSVGACRSGPGRHRAKHVVGASVKSTRSSCFSWGCVACGPLLRDATRATTRLLLPAYAGWYAVWVSSSTTGATEAEDRLVGRWVSADPDQRTWLGVEIRPGQIERIFAYSPDSPAPEGAMYDFLNIGVSLSDFAQCVDVLLDAIDLSAWQESTKARSTILRGEEDLRKRIVDLRDGALSRWTRTTRKRDEREAKAAAGGAQEGAEPRGKAVGGYTEITSYTPLPSILEAARRLSGGEAVVTSVETAHAGTEVVWSAQIEGDYGGPLHAGEVLRTSYAAAGGVDLHRKRREPQAKLEAAVAQAKAANGHSVFGLDVKLRRRR